MKVSSFKRINDTNMIMRSVKQNLFGIQCILTGEMETYLFALLLCVQGILLLCSQSRMQSIICGIYLIVQGCVWLFIEIFSKRVKKKFSNNSLKLEDTIHLAQTSQKASKEKTHTTCLSTKDIRISQISKPDKLQKDESQSKISKKRAKPKMGRFYNENCKLPPFSDKIELVKENFTPNYNAETQSKWRDAGIMILTIPGIILMEEEFINSLDNGIIAFWRGFVVYIILRLSSNRIEVPVLQAGFFFIGFSFCVFKLNFEGGIFLESLTVSIIIFLHQMGSVFVTYLIKPFEVHSGGKSHTPMETVNITRWSQSGRPIAHSDVGLLSHKQIAISINESPQNMLVSSEERKQAMSKLHPNLQQNSIADNMIQRLQTGENENGEKMTRVVSTDDLINQDQQRTIGGNQPLMRLVTLNQKINELNMGGFYSQLFGLLPVGVAIINANKNLLYASSKILQMLNCQDEQNALRILLGLSTNAEKSQKSSPNSNSEDNSPAHYQYVSSNSNFNLNAHKVQEITPQNNNYNCQHYSHIQISSSSSNRLEFSNQNSENIQISDQKNNKNCNNPMNIKGEDDANRYSSTSELRKKKQLGEAVNLEGDYPSPTSKIDPQSILIGNPIMNSTTNHSKVKNISIISIERPPNDFLSMTPKSKQDRLAAFANWNNQKQISCPLTSNIYIEEERNNRGYIPSEDLDDGNIRSKRASSAMQGIIHRSLSKGLSILQPSKDIQEGRNPLGTFTESVSETNGIITTHNQIGISTSSILPSVSNSAKGKRKEKIHSALYNEKTSMISFDENPLLHSRQTSSVSLLQKAIIHQQLLQQQKQEETVNVGDTELIKSGSMIDPDVPNSEMRFNIRDNNKYCNIPDSLGSSAQQAVDLMSENRIETQQREESVLSVLTSMLGQMEYPPTKAACLRKAGNTLSLASSQSMNFSNSRQFSRDPELYSEENPFKVRPNSQHQNYQAQNSQNQDFEDIIKQKKTLGYIQQEGNTSMMQVQYQGEQYILKIIVQPARLGTSSEQKVAIIVMEKMWQEFMIKRVEDLISQKMLLFGSLSHELRTPLNCSISMLQVLQNISLQDPQLQASLDTYIQPALNSNKLLLNMINDILDFVQLDNHSFKFGFVDFDLQNLLKECVSLISIQAKMKKLTLACYYDPQTPKIINSDPNRIRQVVLNFLSNSLKFTIQGHIVLFASLHKVRLRGGRINCYFQNISKQSHFNRSFKLYFLNQIYLITPSKNYFRLISLNNYIYNL